MKTKGNKQREKNAMTNNFTLLGTMSGINSALWLKKKNKIKALQDLAMKSEVTNISFKNAHIYSWGSEE